MKRVANEPPEYIAPARKQPMKLPLVENPPDEEGWDNSSDGSDGEQYAPGPDDWIHSLMACYDEPTQIKLCRAHASALAARAQARKKLYKARAMDVSE